MNAASSRTTDSKGHCNNYCSRTQTMIKGSLEEDPRRFKYFSIPIRAEPMNDVGSFGFVF